MDQLQRRKRLIVKTTCKCKSQRSLESHFYWDIEKNIRSWAFRNAVVLRRSSRAKWRSIFGARISTSRRIKRARIGIDDARASRKHIHPITFSSLRITVRYGVCLQFLRKRRLKSPWRALTSPVYSHSLPVDPTPTQICIFFSTLPLSIKPLV